MGRAVELRLREVTQLAGRDELPSAAEMRMEILLLGLLLIGAALVLVGVFVVVRRRRRSGGLLLTGKDADQGGDQP